MWVHRGGSPAPQDSETQVGRGPVELWGQGSRKANSRLPSRSDSSPLPRCHHCSPHTLRRTLSLACTHPHPTHTTDLVGLTPESLGRKKNKEFGPWGPGPGCGPGGSGRAGPHGWVRTRAPTPQAPGFIQAESKQGGRLEQGWAPGPGGLSPPPQEGEGEATTWRLTSGIKRGPGAFLAAGRQWPNCLQCHECICFLHRF